MFSFEELRRAGVPTGPTYSENYYGGRMSGIGGSAGQAIAAAEADWKKSQGEIGKLIPAIDEKIARMRAIRDRFASLSQLLSNEFSSLGYQIRVLTDESTSYAQEVAKLYGAIEKEYQPILTMYRGFRTFEDANFHPAKPQGATWTGWVPPLFAVVDQRATAALRAATDIEAQLPLIESKAIQLQKSAEADARAQADVQAATARAEAERTRAAQEARDRELAVENERMRRIEEESARQREVDLRRLEIEQRDSEQRAALQQMQIQAEAERQARAEARDAAELERAKRMDDIKLLLELSKSEEGAAVAQAAGLLPPGYEFVQTGQQQQAPQAYGQPFYGPQGQVIYPQQAPQQFFDAQFVQASQQQQPYSGGEMFGLRGMGGMGAFDELSDAQLVTVRDNTERTILTFPPGNPQRVGLQSQVRDMDLEIARRRQAAADSGEPVSTAIARAISSSVDPISQLIRAATGQPDPAPTAPSGGGGGLLNVAVAGVGIAGAVYLASQVFGGKKKRR